MNHILHIGTQIAKGGTLIAKGGSRGTMIEKPYNSHMHDKN